MNLEMRTSKLWLPTAVATECGLEKEQPHAHPFQIPLDGNEHIRALWHPSTGRIVGGPDVLEAMRPHRLSEKGLETPPPITNEG